MKEYTYQDILNATDAYTHDGVFHADDVFATALLKYINPKMKIHRTRELPSGDILAYDIGGGQFDHHTGTTKVRDNEVPYSSFGLIWKVVGKDVMGDEIKANIVDNNLVQPIDITDCTGEQNILSKSIYLFNPLPYEVEENCFWSAAATAFNILQRELANVRYKFSDEVVNKVKKYYDDSEDKHIIILEEPLPWMDILIPTEAEFVVHPGKDGWVTRNVPIEQGTKEGKCYFPEEWRGLETYHLAEVTGIEDAKFCHKSGYLCITNTKESAIQLCKKALHESNKNKTIKL